MLFYAQLSSVQAAQTCTQIFSTSKHKLARAHLVCSILLAHGLGLLKKVQQPLDLLLLLTAEFASA